MLGVLFVKVYPGIVFGLNDLWRTAQLCANRRFSSRRRALAVYEARPPIVREWSEHVRAIARAIDARRGRYAARRALRLAAVGRRCANLRNRKLRT